MEEQKKQVLILNGGSNQLSAAALIALQGEYDVTHSEVSEGASQKQPTQDKPETKWLKGPFPTNRQQKRAFLSQFAARNKKPKAFSMGYRNGRGVGGDSDSIGVNY